MMKFVRWHVPDGPIKRSPEAGSKENTEGGAKDVLDWH
jgi:hypothetical protein